MKSVAGLLMHPCWMSTALGRQVCPVNWAPSGSRRWLQWGFEVGLLTCRDWTLHKEQPQDVVLCKRRERSKYSLASPFALVEPLQCHWWQRLQVHCKSRLSATYYGVNTRRLHPVVNGPARSIACQLQAASRHCGRGRCDASASGLEASRVEILTDIWLGRLSFRIETPCLEKEATWLNDHENFSSASRASPAVIAALCWPAGGRGSGYRPSETLFREVHPAAAAARCPCAPLTYADGMRCRIRPVGR